MFVVQIRGNCAGLQHNAIAPAKSQKYFYSIFGNLINFLGCITHQNFFQDLAYASVKTAPKSIKYF